MKREIFSHLPAGKLDPDKDILKIHVMDDPGPGGANHSYHVIIPENYSGIPGYHVNAIQFQNGPLKENNPNGLSMETLLAIVVDRLQGFQSGLFACAENQMALDHAKIALMTLHSRTLDRRQRGVEGINQK